MTFFYRKCKIRLKKVKKQRKFQNCYSSKLLYLGYLLPETQEDGYSSDEKDDVKGEQQSDVDVDDANEEEDSDDSEDEEYTEISGSEKAESDDSQEGSDMNFITCFRFCVKLYKNILNFANVNVVLQICFDYLNLAQQL